MRVLMFPHPNDIHQLTTGIAQVVHHWSRHLPRFDIELVDPNSDNYDLVAGHAGQGYELGGPYVCHTHGLHWTADYEYGPSHYRMNARIIDACRHARAITTPSEWVAESFRRDMRVNPYVIPHGIDWNAWQHDETPENYVLWNKNRAIGVCDPTPVIELARRFEEQRFVTTFLPRRHSKSSNVTAIGIVPHSNMKDIVLRASVYLSTVKETFGIGTLEALAAGVPVLGYAWGGNLNLVEHGVTGYLARPEDLSDLAEGLDYCLRYRDVLSANAREAARQWTWEAAVERVAEVYWSVVKPEPPTVSVVIPVFNKTEDEIRRALESVIRQTYSRITDINVVDDGSTDAQLVVRTVGRFADENDRIRLIRKGNEGVATARNRGISESGTKYICCLDSDDAIGPDFIARCVEALEADPSLGIAYSGLWYVKPDGSEGLSPWPGRFNFNQQLLGHNQVPTCCVFRREMWERLGGYKQRYAPKGCGSEDAEFWLRAGAYGWNARRVEPVKDFYDTYEIIRKGLKREPSREDIVQNSGLTADEYDTMQRSWFVYSWQSGQVSGNPDYKEVDWTSWHPWAGPKKKPGDGKHPFASMATPEYVSHEVRQYDEPMVSVIIPVGPGHEEKVVDALDSLEAQTFRKWEAIVVWDAGGQHGRVVDDKTVALEMPEASKKLLKAYPYVRLWHTGKGKEGPGWSRNRGAEIARAPFLVFLDADDHLHPMCLEKMLEGWNASQAIVYTDHVHKSIVNFDYLQEISNDDRLLEIQREWEENGEKKYRVVISTKAFDFDCERAQRQPEGDRPWFWCLVTALVPKVWHDEVNGFDEDMESWEDVDYHLRLARAGKCYHRVEEQLVCYYVHTGHRRERGRQISPNLIQYLKNKYERSPTVACPGCGKRRSTKPAPPARLATTGEDWVRIKYTSPNKGDHPVHGSHVFPKAPPGVPSHPQRGGGWRVYYGQRAGGDEFDVLKQDAESTRHFEPIRVQPIAPPPLEDRRPPAPRRMPTGQPTAQGVFERPVKRPPPPARKTVAVTVEEGLSAEIDVTDGVDEYEAAIAKNVLKQRQSKLEAELENVPGVGPKLAGQLYTAGIRTVPDLLELGVEGLVRFKGVGAKKAKAIIEAAAS